MLISAFSYTLLLPRCQSCISEGTQRAEVLPLSHLFPSEHSITPVFHMMKHQFPCLLKEKSNVVAKRPFMCSICRRAAPSAEFSVDRHRHLMSFLTMLGPSPDWNVGLSAEDLCTKDCGWVQKVVQDLIPWDAGTDSGVTYEVFGLLVMDFTQADLPTFT